MKTTGRIQLKNKTLWYEQTQACIVLTQSEIISPQIISCQLSTSIFHYILLSQQCLCTLSFFHPFNSLPNDKILHRSKLEQTADDILKCI